MAFWKKAFNIGVDFFTLGGAGQVAKLAADKAAKKVVPKPGPVPVPDPVPDTAPPPTDTGAEAAEDTVRRKRTRTGFLANFRVAGRPTGLLSQSPAVQQNSLLGV